MTQVTEVRSGRLHAMMGVEPWAVDFVEVTKDSAEIRGWALPPQGIASLASFTLNNRRFEQILYPLPRGDLEKVFWYIPRSEMSGLVCRTTLRADTFLDGHAVLKYINERTEQPVREDHSYYYPDPAKDEAPFPDPERRRRVHGSDDEGTFRLEGYSAHVKLELALGRIFDLGYTHFSNILDWGCGCGRMTRYFRSLAETDHAKITGLDIDADSIHWCDQNLDFGHFSDVPLHPPTDLRDSQFDLLVGVSVFTHLDERAQFEWLNELKRIASDGAILLMTIHGDAAACRNPYMTAEDLDNLYDCGFLDAGQDSSLQSFVADPNYYRTAYHRRSYVLANWSRYFEIVDIIPGYIGNFQDLVVMRKR